MATIALVDNDEDSREVLQVLLETEGHSVQQFSSGKEFLAAFRPGLFKLILLDLSMPKMDGYEVLSRIRREDENVPVVAVTAQAYDTDRERAHAAGFSDFVTKPFTEPRHVFRSHRQASESNGVKRSTPTPMNTAADD